MTDNREAPKAQEAGRAEACSWQRKPPRLYKTIAAARRIAAIDVERWNVAHVVGAPVCVHRDNGEVLRTVTRSKAQMVGDSAVVWVDGISSCYALWCIHDVAVAAVAPSATGDGGTKE